MAIQLGDIAPDFTQDSTEGPIQFHQWLGKSWGILFSHPKDFTPVCTTELGTVAKLKPEFDKRNVKVLAVSVDDVASHGKWAGDIEETQGTKLNYPILRVIDSLQLTDSHSVATPANWKDGDDVIIVPSLQDPEVLKQKFPKGY